MKEIIHKILNSDGSIYVTISTVLHDYMLERCKQDGVVIVDMVQYTHGKIIYELNVDLDSDQHSIYLNTNAYLEMVLTEQKVYQANLKDYID